ncbi:tyrosine-type recombinase/integrase [Dactylosporangium sp. CA-233914]|uniref:tyrosine-type recombinase/integrase n=1 Tax=Dactylosporangium sp. CA-233914 TaxID=3239934 RepID=UPI003D8E7C30
MTGTATGERSDLAVNNGRIPTTDFFADPRLNTLTDAWLRSQRSPNTASAYRTDVRHWAAWCAQRQIDPTAASRTHADDYLHDLLHTPRPATRAQRRNEARAAELEHRQPRMVVGRPLAPSTVARRAAALSNWYEYLQDARPLASPDDPFRRARRPAVERRFTVTVSPAHEDVNELLLAARHDTRNDDAGLGPADGDEFLGPCAYPVILMLVILGARASEVCQLDQTDREQNRHGATVVLHAKGNQRRRRAVPPVVDEAINEYLQHRRLTERRERRASSAALFVGRDGKRLNRLQIYRLVRRVARRAGLPSSDKVTPHSLRHAFNTVAKEAGVSLEDRQDALGHADPRTTQLYDHARMSVLTDPSLRIEHALGLARSRTSSGA